MSGTILQVAALETGNPSVIGGFASQELRTDHSDRMVDLEAEIRMVLTAARKVAQRRFVSLEMAVEPNLVSAADTRACLHDLVLDAIHRAESGVLVTAVRRDGGIDVDVLDDGRTSPGGQPCCAVPHGATVAAEFRPGRGAIVSLRLTLAQPARPADVSDKVD